MAARQAGLEEIAGWFSDTDPEKGRPRPTHSEVVERALADGDPVPGHVLAEYPVLSARKRGG